MTPFLIFTMHNTILYASQFLSNFFVILARISSKCAVEVARHFCGINGSLWKIIDVFEDSEEANFLSMLHEASSWPK